MGPVAFIRSASPGGVKCMAGYMNMAVSNMAAADGFTNMRDLCVIIYGFYLILRNPISKGAWS
jgi:hypothetical protein